MDTGQPSNGPKSNSVIGSTSTEQAVDAAVDVANHAMDAAAERIDRTRRAAEEVIARTKDAAVEAVTSAAKQFSAQAPDIARRVRDEAGPMAADLYQHGDEYLARSVQANPLTALLIAGGVGFGIGYLVSRFR